MITAGLSWHLTTECPVLLGGELLVCGAGREEGAWDVAVAKTRRAARGQALVF
jgi:hypothetical protein